MLPSSWAEEIGHSYPVRAGTRATSSQLQPIRAPFHKSKEISDDMSTSRFRVTPHSCMMLEPQDACKHSLYQTTALSPLRLKALTRTSTRLT